MDAEERNPDGQARIVARSRRQAMDWSLVLASQNIHPIISGGSHSEEWALLVEPLEYERALAAIRQYRAENRGWGWRQELPGANLEIHSGALFWSFFLAAWHWIVVFISPGLRELGRMSSVAVREGEWWRLFTPVVLHADLAHLMANATFGVLMLGLAMARFGFGITLLTTLFAGAAGNLLGLVAYPHPYTGVGASGMMMGALGLLCIHSFSLWRKSPKAARYIISGVLAGFLIFVLFGVDPSSDIVAHLGGFVSGLVFGAVLSFFSEERMQKTRYNAAAFISAVLLLAMTWALALVN